MESALKNLNHGRHVPITGTLWLLLSMPELKRRPDELFLGESTVAHASAMIMNTLLSPNFDLIAFVQLRLMGAGGTLEQSMLYLDAGSAASWFVVANQPGSAASQEYGSKTVFRKRHRTVRNGLLWQVLQCGLKPIQNGLLRFLVTALD